jgi:signal recognition particle subunit SEC65
MSKRISKMLFSKERVSELTSILQKSRGDESEMIDNFLDAKQKSKAGVKAGENHIQNLKTVDRLANEIESAAKDLGIKPSEIKEWKKAKDFLNSNPIKASEIMISKMKSLL